MTAFIDDAQDGDHIRVLPDFYRVRESNLLFAFDYDSSAYIGVEARGSFMKHDDLTREMLVAFQGIEPNADAMRMIGDWCRKQALKAFDD